MTKRVIFGYPFSFVPFVCFTFKYFDGGFRSSDIAGCPDKIRIAASFAPTLTIRVYAAFGIIGEHFIYVKVEGSGAVPAPASCWRILGQPEIT